MNLIKSYHTIRYMNKKQIVYRIKYEVLKRIRRNIKEVPIKIYNKNYNFREYYNRNFSFPLKADSLLNNEFIFLNKLRYKFDLNIDWNADPFNYRLWTFNLNYFDYLTDLEKAYLITSDKKYIYKGIEFINSWIEGNLNYNVDTWDPYVVSKRLYNWINFFCDNKEIISKEDILKIDSSIQKQGIYLLNNIEYYLDANHIIMDGKGIVFFGVYIDDIEIINSGMKVLLREYERQVLNDGIHYERSSSYQVEVLSHYVECYILLNKNNYKKFNEYLYRIINKMAEALYNMIMPNGQIPLVNDSSLDYPFLADDLLQLCSFILNKKLYFNDIISEYVLFLLDDRYIKNCNLCIKDKKLRNIIFDSAGYYIIKDVLNNESLYLLFDCGNLGPDYNLGHAHADNLNLIFMIGNNSILVDSGTYTYKISKERDYYRSTSAHNTLTIDDKNTSEIWSGFRVAKRAKTRLNIYKDLSEYTYISAKHNGYMNEFGSEKIIHNREILYIKGKAIFIIDSVYGYISKVHKLNINYNFGIKNIVINKYIKLSKKNYIKFNICSDNVKCYEFEYSNKFSEKLNCIKFNNIYKFKEDNEQITEFIFNFKDINIKLSKTSIYVFEDNEKILMIDRVK